MYIDTHTRIIGKMLKAVNIAIRQELCLQSTADSPSVRQILVERPDGTPYACGDHLEVMPKNSETQASGAVGPRGLGPFGKEKDTRTVGKVGTGMEKSLQG